MSALYFIGNDFEKRVVFEKESISSKLKFLEYLDLKEGTYAYRVMNRLYDYLFSNAVNLAKEYNSYYKKEFTSKEEYLIKHYNFPYQLAKIASQEAYYYKDLKNVFGDFQMLLEYDEFSEVFLQAIGVDKIENS